MSNGPGVSSSALKLVPGPCLSSLEDLLGPDLGAPADPSLFAVPHADLAAHRRYVLGDPPRKMLPWLSAFRLSMNEGVPSLGVPTWSTWSEVRLKSSPRGSSDSTSFPLNLDFILFFLDLEELGHSVLLVSCALRIEHEAHRALLQPRL